MKDNDVKGGRRVVWSPQERQAEFMQRGEYVALYGGAAGGGKSDALLAEALRQADKACYRGIIFRKTYPQLTELEDRSQTLSGRCNIRKTGLTIRASIMTLWGSMN